ncbi:ABC transporter substrate-binding protein [Ktedonobacter sp. SOSP1-52]|uniref:ABC transporter substrate-binding protein n=1 Tax=Ktedonobacter sp. SOSP1-52 TaxID=2778366 RepID=UPI001914FA35|nr:sugar ABC transporter substrate-binding protein [Ktedonobacter sp. SOSP1-52]GHO68135.1 ABC transporter substrate-binding protein [Ktedonobacter sp. SOSP1-52]
MSKEYGLLKDFLAGKIDRRNFIGRALALGMTLGGVEAVLQACGSGGNAGGKANISWSTWGDAARLKLFFDYTNQFNASHPDITAQFKPIPTTDIDYGAKILTQLTGGVAPDVFYVPNSSMTQYIQDQVIVDLTPLLNGPKSQEKASDYINKLWGVSRTPDGKIYGVPVDCNPYVIWYNKTVLQEAGITQMPADLYEQGKWNRETFSSMLAKVAAKGKTGYILTNATLMLWSWVTTNGGVVYDNNGRGKFVANQDPRSIEAFTWLANNIRAKKIVYAGILPKGQGADFAFISNQVAFVSAGRYYLPAFRQASNLQYDIVPLPPNTGKRLEPAGVPVTSMSVNSKTKYPDAAFQFLTSYVSTAGQKFRIQGASGSIPSIQGIDQIATSGNTPEHARYFIDTRNVGYASFQAEDSTPGLTTDILKELEPVWLQGADVQQTLNKVANMANQRITEAKSGQ